MTLQEVQELVKAGFTHDEIMSFTSKQKETKQEETKQEETKQEETKQEETKQEETKQEETKQKETAFITDSAVEKFTIAVNNLTKTIQASNLQNAFNEGNNKTLEDTAVEALSSIITKPKGDS